HRLGDHGDVTELIRAAGDRGIRVIADLVVNHTSNEHPWFEASRRDPDGPHGNYYVWQDEPPEGWDTSLIFPGDQETNWTWDDERGAYYLHHFYEHQPDVNPDDPGIRAEFAQIISFWLQQGLAGFRVDAVPYLINLEGIAGPEEITPHGLLRELRAKLTRRRGDAVMLGEVNVAPDEQRRFFGENRGDELHMVFNFHVNQHLLLALARRDPATVRDALRSLPEIPPDCQWANFLKNHDEATLDQLDESERAEVFAALGPEEHMQLYDRGLRRRIPPMLGGDMRRIRMAYSLLFALPGTPVLFYGEEIGMGENLDVPDRLAVRTPMQWSSGPTGGFSTADADAIRRPPPAGDYGPDRVNVADQLGEPDSMLNWTNRLVRRRRQTPELGYGRMRLLDVGAPGVLAMRVDWQDRTVVTLHNFGADDVDVSFADAVDADVSEIIGLWADSAYDDDGKADVTLRGDGYRWFRLRKVGQDQLL
ncbi:MAG: alpha-amylase family glycosyl hydrolase, partial [Actinomycetota bacterium]|nr:alpha-amylase family glycosyl hydrolase [Actinomycetota bacterium]